MTDETTTDAPPPALRVFTCYNRLHPTRSCYALIEDADEPRRKHREWHDSLVSKDEGQRKAIKARDDEIAKLHDAIGRYERTAAAALEAAEGFRTDVQRVETPIAPPALEIDRNGYTDEELAEEPDEPEDDWALPRTITADPEPVADPEDDEHTDPEVDPDLDPTVRTSAFGSVARSF